MGSALDFFRRKPDEMAVIIEAVRQSIEGIRPDGGVVVIKELTININYASGGGAKVVAK